MENEYLTPIEKAFISSIEKANRKAQKKEQRFNCTGINIPGLVAELEKRKFFDTIYKAMVLDWFNGSAPKEPIPLSIPGAWFVSIIADIMDIRPKFINNSKEYVYTYIQNSFLFNGKKPEISTIKQVMKPSPNKNRVFYQSKLIPNIQDFRK